ncbi:hypothetical protein [Streptomyces sp. NPDC051704]|uniref:hypothetical protein n=1 Tax=Streptomyces sp. NPDC051704 TaxID=3365671 RepID=UPI0037B0042B
MGRIRTLIGRRMRKSMTLSCMSQMVRRNGWSHQLGCVIRPGNVRRGAARNAPHPCVTVRLVAFGRLLGRLQDLLE